MKARAPEYILTFSENEIYDLVFNLEKSLKYYMMTHYYTYGFSSLYDAWKDTFEIIETLCNMLNRVAIYEDMITELKKMEKIEDA